MNNGNRLRAHRVIDWVWSHVHLTGGQITFLVAMSLALVAAHKIDSSANQQAREVSNSVCAVIAQADKGVVAQRTRVRNAIARNEDRLHAQKHIASVWKAGLDKTPKDSPSYPLLRKVYDGEQQLVVVSQGDVSDLRVQLKAIKPIELKGC